MIAASEKALLEKNVLKAPFNAKLLLNAQFYALGRFKILPLHRI